MNSMNSNFQGQQLPEDGRSKILTNKAVLVARFQPYMRRKRFQHLLAEEGIDSILIQQIIGKYKFVPYPLKKRTAAAQNESSENQKCNWWQPQYRTSINHIYEAPQYEHIKSHSTNETWIKKNVPKDDVENLQEHTSQKSAENKVENVSEHIESQEMKNKEAQEIYLPVECIANIASFLPFSERAKMEQISRLWRSGTLESYHGIHSLSTLSPLWDNSWNSPVLTSEKIQWAVKRCNLTLREIILQDNVVSLTTHALSCLGEYCTNLRRISATGLVEGSVDTELSNIFKVNKNLITLEFIKSNVTGESFIHIHDKIEKFVADNCHELQPNFLHDFLKRQTQLKDLQLICGKQLDDRQVTHVIVENCHIRETLESLKITFLGYSTPFLDQSEDRDEPIPTPNAAQSGFAPFIELEQQTLQISLPAYLRNLRILELRFCSWVDNKFISDISEHLRLLHYLDITGCSNIRGESALQPLEQMNTLQVLKMNMFHPSISKLYVNVENLEVLECRDCIGINSEEVIQLLRLSEKLNLLDLEGCINVDRSVVEYAYNMLRTRERVLPLTMLLGGTKAEHHRKDRINKFLNIQYTRQSISI